MFKTSAIHPPPNKLGGGLLAEDDKLPLRKSGPRGFSEVTKSRLVSLAELGKTYTEIADIVARELNVNLTKGQIAYALKQSGYRRYKRGNT